MNDFNQYNQEYYTEGTRVKKLRIKRLRKRKLFFRLFILLLIITSGLYLGYNYGESVKGMIYGSIGWTFAGDASDAGALGTTPEDPQINILIMGTDQRGDEPSRSDTQIVVMLNPETKKAHFLSLPRDSRVEIEGYKYKTKLNHAHAKGGVELAKDTVANLLDLKIHKYVEINFKGFEDVIDSIGGIEIDVEKRMYYPEEDINIKKGFQKLDGHDALGYVRYRSDGKGDLGRIERQQNFLKVLIEQNLKLGTLLKLPDIFGEINDNVETDLTAAELLYLTKEFKSTASSNIDFHQLPGKPQYVNGASYYIINEEEMRSLLSEMKSDLKVDDKEIDNKEVNNEENDEEVVE